MPPANGGRLLVVVDEESGAQAVVALDVLGRLRKGHSHWTAQVLTLVHLRENPATARADVRLLVSVGSQATLEVSRLASAPPVLAVLLPRATFEYILAQRPPQAAAASGALTAIYLDQPLGRQLRLIGAALPGMRDVGVLLGPTSSAKLGRLQAAAAATGFRLTPAILGNEAPLIPALRDVLADCDVLLALPDPRVYNKSTAQSILLTTYRRRVPVVGFSKAYTTAGALLSLYSTPEQVAEEVVSVVDALPDTGPLHLPPPSYPRLYSVATNPHVAHSLGLALKDGTTLSAELARACARRVQECAR